jgi:hypothetical protein
MHKDKERSKQNFQKTILVSALETAAADYFTQFRV